MAAKRSLSSIPSLSAMHSGGTLDTLRLDFGSGSPIRDFLPSKPYDELLESKGHNDDQHRNTVSENRARCKLSSPIPYAFKPSVVRLRGLHDTKHIRMVDMAQIYHRDLAAKAIGGRVG